MRVLICGGGVIGACIAYFLSQRRVEAVVIERTGIACAASGKSGGFLALDWCDGTPLAPLARRSFALHAELAAKLGGWDYRRLDTLAVAASARRALRGSGSALPDWVARDAALQQQLGTTRTTAQVHPEKFTRGMMDDSDGAGRAAADRRGHRPRARCRRARHGRAGRWRAGSRPMPWWSRWARGRCSPASGCRCRWFMG